MNLYYIIIIILLYRLLLNISIDNFQKIFLNGIPVTFDHSYIIFCSCHFTLILVSLLFLYSIGIPTLVYGIGSWCLVHYSESVHTSCGNVIVYFLNKEDKDAHH